MTVLTEVLYVPREALRNIRAHAMEYAEIECCGLLGGASNGVAMLARVSNHAAIPTTAFRIDPADQYKVEKMFEARDEGCFLIGVYHSHPTKDASPSAADIEQIPASLFSLIYSVRDDEIKAWRGGVQVDIEAT